MKNEFLYSRIIFTTRKKNYTGNIICQEGVLIDNKLDIKGLAIKKSNVNRNISSTLKNILHEDILKSDDISLPGILRSIKDLEDSIKKAFLDGSIEYLTPTSSKKASDYKNPLSIAPFRAALAWNTAYPNNPIMLPDNFNMFKCTITKLEDITEIYDKDPELYKRLKAEIFDNPDTAKFGITYFAVPKNVKEIPEWIIPYIDVETIINDNISSFNPLLQSLGLKIISNSEGDFYSNILSI